MINEKKVVNKFIVFLKEYQRNIQDAILEGFLFSLKDELIPQNDETLKFFDQENIIVSNFLDIFLNFEKRKCEIFFQFYYLSGLLEKSNLNAKECATIIFMMIKRNLDACILENDSYFVNIESIEKFHFKTMTPEEVYHFICDIGMEKLNLAAENNPELQEKVDELVAFAEKYAHDFGDFRENNSIICKNYFEKIDSFDENDIELILLALKKLSVSSKLLKYVEISLNKDYQKRKNNTEKKAFCWKKEEKVTNLLSDKEYKLLRKELESYYRVYQNELVRDINYSDMIYCLSLMYKLGIEEANIDQFLLKYRLTSTSIKDPIQWFVFFYEKLLYHQKDVRVMTSFQQLLEYMSDIFVVDDEEYLYVKEEMRKEESKIENLLVDNFEYEKIVAKKRMKKRPNL